MPDMSDLWNCAVSQDRGLYFTSRRGVLIRRRFRKSLIGPRLRSLCRCALRSAPRGPFCETWRATHPAHHVVRRAGRVGLERLVNFAVGQLHFHRRVVILIFFRIRVGVTFHLSGQGHIFRVRSSSKHKCGSAGADFHLSTIFTERPIRSFIKERRSIPRSGHTVAQRAECELNADLPEKRPQALRLGLPFGNSVG